jgi:hypothetical protein
MRYEALDRLMRIAGLLLMAISIAHPAAAQSGVQMPDPKQMSGVPLPSGDLPVGTLTVRLIRGSLSNPLPGQRVEITGDAEGSATTNESGRAEFTRLRPGARVAAKATIDGEQLESQQIQIPMNGGIRVMLVATDPETAKRAEEDRRLAQGPAIRGTVVIGDQSRFVFELGDEAFSVFNIAQILNTARVPVEPVTPVSFVLPDGARQATILEGSSPLATLAGGRVDVKGPFPPGVTLVQFAYSLPYSGAAVTVRQVLPAQLTQLTIVAQKVGEMRLTSAQIGEQRDMTSEGQTYILARGPAVAAGQAVEFQFTGLPHSATWPRNLAFTLASAILAGGVFFSFRRRDHSPQVVERTRLERDRSRLLNELAKLEADQRSERLEQPTYASRRARLISELERVYAALDQGASA